jgi:hypothetical protein
MGGYARLKLSGPKKRHLWNHAATMDRGLTESPQTAIRNHKVSIIPDMHVSFICVCQEESRDAEVRLGATGMVGCTNSQEMQGA